MPTGSSNAPATFQLLMNRVFQDCIDLFLLLYIDGILIYSNKREEHLEHIGLALSRLKEHKFYASPKKCASMKDKVEFLGFVVGFDGLGVHPHKFDVIRNWPRLINLTKLRSFLRLMQFFCRFIFNFSACAALLYGFLQQHSGIRNWDHCAKDAFEYLKCTLMTAPVLVPPDWSRPFRLYIDALQIAVGAHSSKLTLTVLTELEPTHRRSLRKQSRTTWQMRENFWLLLWRFKGVGASWKCLRLTF